MTKNDENPLGETMTIPTLTPIAIIGIAGIMPEAENIDQLWQNILDEVNCIKEVPPSRWKIEDYYDPDPNVPDKSYNKYGGFIPDISFDPMEFGLPPNLLEVTDVSQLLSLVVAKNALKDAGYLETSEKNLDQTGVILGMVGMSSKVIHPLLNRLQYPIWEKVLLSSSLPESEIPEIIEKMKSAYIQWNENAFPGAIGNVVAGRIANRLDLGGANCIVDAACASSLAAVNMAVSELALGKADMMITGGVDTDNSILTYLCFSKTPAFSKGEYLKAFSEDSDGMLTGEGIGMLVLKRLEDAESDGDRIYAVIRGIGASSDGHFKSIYAPRSSGQAKAIRRAYQHANYNPSTVRLIEAHGTGTNAGDPAEFQGLTEAFSDVGFDTQGIALGSIKSQIGHTKATAGAASLIKTALALHQRILPATINVTKPHPAMNIESTPFYLNTETRPWFANTSGIPRRAGVSSFGFGGTNFHITMEEYKGNNQESPRRRSVPNSIILSAATPPQLLDVCRLTVKGLKSSDAESVFNQLGIDSYSKKIPPENARIGFVAKSIPDVLEIIANCIKMLEGTDPPKSWSHPQGIYYRSSGSVHDGEVVALFPGQGSQYVNMGRELALNFPQIRNAFEETDQVFSQSEGDPLTKTVFPIPVFTDDNKKKQKQELTNTEYAQPAIGTLSLAMYQVLKDAGFSPDHFAGHSFGELTALCAAGVYDKEAFVRLAIARGKAMASSPSSKSDTGSMIAVKGDIIKLQEILQNQNEITIANFNSTSQVVLAGSSSAIEAFKEKLENLEYSVYPLNVSAAFHTHFVAHAQSPFREAIKKEAFQKPIGAVYSNSTAKKHDPNPKNIAKNLEDHILNPVNFKEEIENIYKNGGHIFIEIGPKKVLTNLVKDILKDQPYETIALNPNPRSDSDLQLRQAVVLMRVLGIEIKNIDPNLMSRHNEPDKHSKVSVTLNGGLYTSQKTKDEFQNALTNTQSKPNKTDKDQNPSSKAQSLNTSQDKGNHVEVNSMDNTNVNISPLVEKLQEHQNNILNTHQQFLTNDTLSKSTIKDLISIEISLLSKMGATAQSTSDERALALLEKRVEAINYQQEGVSNAHKEFIQSQAEFTKQYVNLICQLTDNKNHSLSTLGLSKSQQDLSLVSPMIESIEESTSPQPESIEPQSTQSVIKKGDYGFDEGHLKAEFLGIVSEKTGYPTDMLEVEMDMEADLGIDSIKRVEILGTMQEKFPSLPTIPAEDLVELRTLEQIIDNFVSSASHTPVAKEPPEAPTLVNQKTAQSPKVGDSTPNPDLYSAFLNIVSEKTGYPTDMLEIEMDMEADLGIDSIKRVEILGNMQEQFPNLPTIEAEVLVELRTIKQIINYFNSETVSKDPLPEEYAQTPIELSGSINTDTDLERRDIKIKKLPRPDFLEFDFKPESLVLITDDGSDKAERLSSHFSEKKIQVGLIHFCEPPKNFESLSKNGTKHYYIPKPEDAKVEACMHAITNKRKDISAFIHISSATKDNGSELIALPESDTAILKSVFLVARHLGNPLSETAKNGRSAFLTITNMDGQFGLNEPQSHDPILGGYAGLAKSLRLEWPTVFCRAIDIHPKIHTDSFIKIIISELHDPNSRIAEVGYTPNGRFTIAAA